MKDFPHASLVYLTEPERGSPVLNIQVETGAYPMQFGIDICHVIGLIRDGANMLHPGEIASRETLR